MWSGDWRNFPQETLSLLRKSEECRTYLEEAQHYLYTLGNEEDGNDLSRVVRVACLEPYLFGHSFFNKDCEIWAQSSGIFKSTDKVADSELTREVREIILVLDTLAYHVSLLIHLVSNKIYTTESLNVLPVSRLSDKQQDLLTHFEEETSYSKVVPLVQQSNFYSLFRKKLQVTSLREEQVLGCFLVVLKAALSHSRGSLGSLLPYVLDDQRINKVGEDKLKNSGNQKFKEKKFKEAYNLYTDAINKTRYSHLLYSNRAQCSLRLQQYQEAEMDARRTVILCPNFEKGYYKMVQVYDGQQNQTQALQVLEFYRRRCTLLNLNISCDMQELQKKVTESNKKLKNGKIDSHCTPVKKKPKPALSIPVPDLVSESESEPEETKVLGEVDQVQNAAVQERSTKGETTVVKDVAACRETIRKASEDLVEGLYKSAYQAYKKVVSSKHDLPEFDLVLLKYALGHSCVKMGSLEDLNEAVKVLMDITDNHKKVVFPLAYLGLAQAHVKMNRFTEALPYITKGLDIINKGIFFSEAITWPESKQKVEMKDKASLKKALEELYGVCRTPPKPDAICRSKDCPLHPNIYYTDPDFKGFQQLHCRSRCLIQYHPTCWKDHREEVNLTEKGFLGTMCLTPDCKDIIIEVETIEKDGTRGRHFVHSEYDKENIPKQKKTKKEKKQEQRELKKKRRDANVGHSTEQKDDDLTCVTSAGCESVGSTHDDIGPGPADSGRQEAPKSEGKATLKKESNSEEPKPEADNTKESKADPHPMPPTSDAPYMLKRDEDEELLGVKTKKSKDKKKRNRAILTLDIGPNVDPYSEYQERIAKLAFQKNIVEEGLHWGTFCERQKERFPSLDPSRPFFIPVQLRDNEVALEAVLQHRGGNDVCEDVQDIRENLYEYIQDYLLSCGPRSVNDPIFMDEVENFLPAARSLIKDAGGLFNFLLQSMRFYMDNDIVYTYPYRSSDISGGSSPIDVISSFDDQFPLQHNTANILRDVPPLLDSSDNDSSDFSECDAAEKSAEDNEESALMNNDVETSSSLSPCAENFTTLTLPSPSAATLAKSTPRLPTPPPPAEPSAETTAKKDESKQKNAAVVVQNLLPMLSQRHLLQCVTAALSCLEKGVSVQALEEINRSLHLCKLVSKSRKTDSAVQVTLKDSDSEQDNIREQYLQLQRESAMLKEQLDNALDANCKLKRKFTLDMGQTKEKLDEVTAELQESKESWKKAKIEMEAEIKKLQQDRQKMKELKNELKTAKNASADPNSPENCLDRVVAELTKERYEHEELQENFKMFQEAADKAVERAKVAEITVLKTKLKWANDRYEHAVRGAKKVLQDLECIPILSGTDYQFAREVVRGKELASTYIRDLAALYGKFERDVNIHIGKVKDGTPWSDLPVLNLPNIDEFNYVPPPFPPPSLLNGGPPFSGPQPIHPIAGACLLPASNLMMGPPLFHMNRPHSPLRRGPSGGKPITATSGPPPGLAGRSTSSLRGRSPASLMNSMDDIAGDATTSNLDSGTQIMPAPALTEPPSARGVGATNEVMMDERFRGSSSFGTKSLPTHSQGNILEIKPLPKGDRSERLLIRLQAKFPNIPQEDIVDYLRQVRTMKKGLTGMTITEIIDHVTEIVEKDQPRPPRTLPKTFINREPVRGTLRPMLNESGTGASGDPLGPTRRMWAMAGKKDMNRQWDGKDSQCSICLEDLDWTRTQVTNSCGHTFHEACIQGWYKNDHTCPNCRAHSLPETDFPALGK